jgi:hypothetical protein
MFSIIGTIKQDGKEIKNIVLPCASNQEIIEKLKEVQVETNEFLTDIILKANKNGSGDNIQEDTEEDDEEDSDSNEPDLKIPKLT